MLAKGIGALRKALGRDSAPATPAAPDDSAIHKGAYVDVRLYLEGDEPPAHDFAQTARDAAARVLAAGIVAAAAPLRVTVQRIEVDDDPPDADDAGEQQ